VVHGHHRCRRHAAAAVALAALAALSAAGQAQVDSSTRRRSGEPPYTVLALGDVSTSASQHDSVSHALATIEGLGLQAGLFSNVIRTDTQLVTKGAIAAATGTLTYYKNLDDFDAVLLFIEGNPPLTAQQRSDLAAFVHAGKGLIAVHTTVAAFDSWPEFRDLLGIGKTMGHAVESSDQNVTSIGRTSFFPEPFQIRDRIVPVVLNRGVHVLATSHGTPAVWTTHYGKGRVFVSQLGHDDVTWDRTDVQYMILEAIRWAVTRASRPAPASAPRERRAAGVF
jgi:type 1 glutamine amidotransferase